MDYKKITDVENSNNFSKIFVNNNGSLNQIDKENFLNEISYKEVYGVECDLGENDVVQSNPVLKRTDNAVGMAANPSYDGMPVQNDFDYAKDWPSRRRCNGHIDPTTKKFVVDAYKGSSNYKEDNPNINVFVETQKFYYFKGIINNKLKLQISTKKFFRSEVFPAFINPETGVENDFCYTAAFEGAIIDGKLTSISGIIPGNISYNTGVTSARACGEGYNLSKSDHCEMNRLLFTIEFATNNCQSIYNGACSMGCSPNHVATIDGTATNKFILSNSNANIFVIGQTIAIGTSSMSSNLANNRIITSKETYDDNNTSIIFDGDPINISVGNFISSRPWKTGSCNNVKASSGTFAGSNDNRYPFVYRGIENIYANTYKPIGDVIFHNGSSTYYCCKNPKKWIVSTNTISSDYVALSYKYISTSSGYITKLGLDDKYKEISLVERVGGSSVTYYCDYSYRSESSSNPDMLRECLYGGSLTNGSFCGFSYWDLRDGLSAASWGLSGWLSVTD